MSVNHIRSAIKASYSGLERSALLNKGAGLVVWVIRSAKIIAINTVTAACIVKLRVATGAAVNLLVNLLIVTSCFSSRVPISSENLAFPCC